MLVVIIHFQFVDFHFIWSGIPTLHPRSDTVVPFRGLFQGRDTGQGCAFNKVASHLDNFNWYFLCCGRFWLYAFWCWLCRSPSVENPGNNLYVTGLSPRVTKRELEKHFAAEGKVWFPFPNYLLCNSEVIYYFCSVLSLRTFGLQVTDVHLVVDPWTRESRGFGFVTMENVDEAERCIKYLDGSVLEGRVITVEKVMYLNFSFRWLINCDIV